MRYNGLSSAKRREKVNPRKSWSTKGHESDTKRLIHETGTKSSSTKSHELGTKKLVHETTLIRHEKACPRISRIWAESLCTSDSSIPSAPLFPLHIYSLSTSIPSAPLLLQSSVHEITRIRHEKACPRKDTNPARKACLATSVFYTLLINKEIWIYYIY